MSFIEGRRTADGSLLWTQDILDQDGSDVAVYSKPTLSPDGQTAYFTALELPITPTSTFRIFAVDTSAEDGSTPGDLDGNGMVDGADLAMLLGAWGACGDCDNCDTDLDGNCVVDGADLAILLGNWG